MQPVFIRTFKLKKGFLSAVLVSLVLLIALNSVFTLSRGSPVTSWAVTSRLIVIDPGHGGIDPGAVGYNGVKEKDIVLQVGKRLKSLLNQAGAMVLMTRESDIDLGTPGSGRLLTRKRADLSQRVKLANDNKADLYLSIHVNAIPSSRWRGAQTFYQRNRAESKKLAHAIQSELVRILGNTNRVAKSEDFYTTRNTNMTSVIIEIGFISNPAEAKLLTDPAYQRKLAYAIYSGLVKYYTREAPKQK